MVVMLSINIRSMDAGLIFMSLVTAIEITGSHQSCITGLKADQQ